MVTGLKPGAVGVVEFSDLLANGQAVGRFDGMVVFLSMSFVNTPPKVSIPRESGVTSSKSTSFTSPRSTP